MNFRIHFYRACSSMRTMGVGGLRERESKFCGTEK